MEISVEERKVTNSTSVGRRRKSSSKNWVINKSDGFPLDGIEDTKCRRWCRSPDVRTIFQTRSYLGYVKSIQFQRRQVPSSLKEKSKLFSSWCCNWSKVSVPAMIMFKSNTNKIEWFLILHRCAIHKNGVNIGGLLVREWTCLRFRSVELDNILCTPV